MTASAKDASAALEELLGTLRDNGTISQGQHDQLIRGLQDEGEVTETGKEAESEATEKVQEIATSGRVTMELGGELMIDSAFYDEDKSELGDGTEIRRARLKAEGKLFDWTYELGLGFAGGDVEIKDAYFGYEEWPSTSLMIGQFKEPFSLEELTSAKYITFMERALPVAFAPGRKIGIGAHKYWDTLTVAGGLFGESFDDDVDDEGDEGWGVAGRLTYSPIHRKTRAVHFGAATEYREPNDDDETRFDTKPESNVTNVKYANTGKIKEVDSTAKYGLEAAGVWGPFSGQAEYLFTDISRHSGARDVNLDGWYAYGSWFLTGESRNYRYRKGTFGRVKPLHRYGAWELAARYSMIDLTDGLVTGGEEQNITLGLNWYINPYLRVMANYIMIDNDENADDDGDVAVDDQPDAFQLRLQGNF
ncbi:MAG: porin [Pseudomonadota bacterium]